MTIAMTTSPVQHVQSEIVWSVAKSEWDSMIERHDKERAEFIRDLIQRKATQEEIAAHLNVSRVRVSQWCDYDATLRLVTPVTNSEPPAEWELRPFVQAASSEVAAERGVQRVRDNREEVHRRAAEFYNNEATWQKPHVANNAGNNEWYTPEEYIDAATAVMGGIDLDPASSERANEIVCAKKFYTADDDGLSKKWKGRIWMNPPYAGPLIGRFAEKIVQHVSAGDIDEAIVLVNNATETQWFADLAGVASAVVFPTARVKFWSPDGRIAAPLQGQAVIYIGPKRDKFIKSFSQFGWAAKV